MNMKRIAIYGVIGILILMFYILYCPKASSMDGKVDTLVVSHFTKETSLEKEFSNKENSIEGIGFRFETYGNKKNKGHLNFKILDEDNVDKINGNVELYLSLKLVMMKFILYH